MPLRSRDNGADVAKSHERKGYCLEEEVNKVVVLSVEKIVARAEEEECREPQLQQMNSANFKPQSSVQIINV